MKTNLLWAGAGCLMLMLCGVTRASVVTFDRATDTITIEGGGTIQMPAPSYYRDYDYTIVMPNYLAAPSVASVPPKVTTNTSGTKGSTGSNSGSTGGTKSDTGSGSSGNTNTGTNSGDDNGNTGGSSDPVDPSDPGSTTTGGGSNPTNNVTEVVPLPASWAMGAVGLAGVALISWRRSRTQAA